MAIDKALYEAPMGLQALETEPLEIEIENPDSVSIGMDGIEVEIEPGRKEKTGIKDFSANLAEHMDETALQLLSDELLSLIHI